MFEAVVIGVSAGGMSAISRIIPVLPQGYRLPVMIVQHRAHDSDDFLVSYINKLSYIHVKEANSGELIKPECVYIAPPGYHLLVEREKTLSLNVDPPVSYAIPSIDMLFETAAAAYGAALVGVILTGANSDGSRGLRAVKESGGLTIVQNPETADSSAMPKAAIEIAKVDHTLHLDEIGVFLEGLNK